MTNYRDQWFMNEFDFWQAEESDVGECKQKRSKGNRNASWMRNCSSHYNSMQLNATEMLNSIQYKRTNCNKLETMQNKTLEYCVMNSNIIHCNTMQSNVTQSDAILCKNHTRKAETQRENHCGTQTDRQTQADRQTDTNKDTDSHRATLSYRQK